MKRYFLIVFTVLNLTSLLQVQASQCTILSEEIEGYHAVTCDGIKGYVKKENLISSFKFNIVKKDKTVMSEIAETELKGTIASFTTDLATNTEFITKHGLKFGDTVVVDYTSFNIDDENVIVENPNKDENQSTGITLAEYKKQKDSKTSKEELKKKMQEMMKEYYCFHGEKDAVHVIGYKESCNDQKFCYSKVHCIKEDKEGIMLDYFRTQAVCAMVNGACPTANDCARDYDVDMARLAVKTEVLTEEAQASETQAK